MKEDYVEDEDGQKQPRAKTKEEAQREWLEREEQDTLDLY